MITLTNYTTYDSVRSVLGVDTDELTDVELAKEFYALSLKNDLSVILPGTSVGGAGSLFVKYEFVRAIAEVSRTADQQTLYDFTKVLSSFLVARSVLSGISLRARKMETDGKAATTRFSSEETFKAVKEEVASKISSLITIINNVGVAYTVSVAQYLGVVSPDLDIVEETVR